MSLFLHQSVIVLEVESDRSHNNSEWPIIP